MMTYARLWLAILCIAVIHAGNGQQISNSSQGLSRWPPLFDHQPIASVSDFRRGGQRAARAPVVIPQARDDIMHVHSGTRADSGRTQDSTGRIGDTIVPLVHSHDHPHHHDHPIRPSQFHIDLPGEHGNNSSYPVVHRDIHVPVPPLPANPRPTTVSSRPAFRPPSAPRSLIPSRVPQVTLRPYLSQVGGAIEFVGGARPVRDSGHTEGLRGFLERGGVVDGFPQTFEGQIFPPIRQFTTLTDRSLTLPELSHFQPIATMRGPEAQNFLRFPSPLNSARRFFSNQGQTFPFLQFGRFPEVARQMHRRPVLQESGFPNDFLSGFTPIHHYPNFPSQIFNTNNRGYSEGVQGRQQMYSQTELPFSFFPLARTDRFPTNTFTSVF